MHSGGVCGKQAASVLMMQVWRQDDLYMVHACNLRTYTHLYVEGFNAAHVLHSRVVCGN